MMRRFLALCYLLVLVLVSFSCAFRVKPTSSSRHAGPLQQQQQRQQPEAEGRISSGAPTQKTSETLLDEDDPILAIPNIQESSSSSSSTSPWSPHAAAATSSSSSSSSTSSSEKEMEKEKQKQKEEDTKKSLGSNVGAAEVEDLLQALDEKEGRLKKKEEEEEARKNSSGVGQLLDEALRLIGKVFIYM